MTPVDWKEIALSHSGPRHTRCQFHQHFTYKFFIRTSFLQLFLVTFWLWQKICTKNARVKRWWNHTRYFSQERISSVTRAYCWRLGLWNVTFSFLSKLAGWRCRNKCAYYTTDIYYMYFLLLIFAVLTFYWPKKYRRPLLCVAFLSVILCICGWEMAVSLEPILKFTVILGLFMFKFIICELIFWVPISRI